MSAATSQAIAPSFPESSESSLVELPSPQRFIFRASGSEYFRIWIVNLLLTILTLGIYSAWAKVRTLRYFYGSTQVAGARFDYHGDPLSILKGRLLAAALIILYNIISGYSLIAYLAMAVLLMLCMPWLIWKSLQFKLHNSSYRGIRFGFNGSLGKAYWHYLMLPLMSLLTINLLAPLVHQRLKRFQHSESRFGITNFAFDGSAGSFYKVYLLGLLAMIGGFAVIGFVAGASVIAAFKDSSQLSEQAASLIIIGIAIYGWMFLCTALLMTMIQNLVWNSTSIDGHRFTSDMKWRKLAFIMSTNLLMVMITFGLYTPFAQIRQMKYRLESMTLIPASSLDSFIADSRAGVSAGSEGMADLLDFDMSL